MLTGSHARQKTVLHNRSADGGQRDEVGEAAISCDTERFASGWLPIASASFARLARAAAAFRALINSYRPPHRSRFFPRSVARTQTSVVPNSMHR